MSPLASDRDPGLFGPQSVTWRIHSDSSAWLGGGRALLVQALQPATMAVFAQNTNYREDPWGRLLRTSAYVGATVFGDTETACGAARRLRGIHARLRGVDPVTGVEHRADDPELLLWVHATAVHSFLTAYRRYAWPISDEDADQYVAEMIRFAELVGLDAAEVPATTGELSEYLRGVTGLRATPEAKAGMRMVLFFPPVPLPLRPMWSVVSASVIALLPRKTRRLYGLPWFPPAGPSIRATGFALSRLSNVVMPRIPRIRGAYERAVAAA
jgi:uncharacterized protein (DUF2236 family)